MGNFLFKHTIKPVVRDGSLYSSYFMHKYSHIWSLIMVKTSRLGVTLGFSF